MHPDCNFPPKLEGHLAFSNRCRDSYSFSSCDWGLEQLLLHLPRSFPELRPFLGGEPLLISCFPACLGPVENIAVVDTYLRQEPFSRALSLASSLGKPAVLFGHPLTVTHMLLSHIQMDCVLPRTILIVLGGYHCPRSLERYLRDLLLSRDVSAQVAHAYSLAELGFGCLAGMRREGRSDVGYYRCRPKLQMKIEPETKKLLLRLSAETDWLDTGDRAYEMPRAVNQVVIRNDSSALHPEVLDELESWGRSSWSRRTGYAARCADSVKVQLRQGLEPSPVHAVSQWFVPVVELEHYEFCREFQSSWNEKPSWG
ncbi:MAG: hypothetical protein U0136_03245 [Bdellovibrionota bacterium]